MKPVLLVIAGPNGSGKTTVTVRLRTDRWSEGVEYLNPDGVARSHKRAPGSMAVVIDQDEYRDPAHGRIGLAARLDVRIHPWR
jgi:predicted ABC-type ATPase